MHILSCYFLSENLQETGAEYTKHYMQLAPILWRGKNMEEQEGHEALNCSPEFTGQSQTFNFEI